MTTTDTPRVRKGASRAAPVPQEPPVDLFDRLLEHYTESRGREKLLAGVLRRVLCDDRDIGSLSPNTVLMIRQALGLPPGTKEQRP